MRFSLPCLRRLLKCGIAGSLAADATAVLAMGILADAQVTEAHGRVAPATVVAFVGYVLAWLRYAWVYEAPLWRRLGRGFRWSQSAPEWKWSMQNYAQPLASALTRACCVLLLPRAEAAASGAWLAGAVAAKVAVAVCMYGAHLLVLDRLEEAPAAAAAAAAAAHPPPLPSTPAPKSAPINILEISPFTTEDEADEDISLYDRSTVPVVRKTHVRHK